MRLNDRLIRDELRKQAMSVNIPEEMWAKISRELDTHVDKAPVHPLRAAEASPRSRSLQLRQVLAIGAAAGIFWMMVIPSSAYVDRLNQPEAIPRGPVASAPAAATSASEIPRESTASEQPEKENPPPTFKGHREVRRPALAILR